MLYKLIPFTFYNFNMNIDSIIFISSEINNIIPQTFPTVIRVANGFNIIINPMINVIMDIITIAFQLVFEIPFMLNAICNFIILSIIIQALITQVKIVLIV